MMVIITYLVTEFILLETLEDYRHPNISVGQNFLPLELDFFYPRYNLAFEFQGQQHYKNVDVYHRIGSLGERKTRDELKYSICKENGIFLVEL